MRKYLLTLAALAAVLAPMRGLAADPSPAGLWQGVDDETKQPTGWFLIRDHGDGTYVGIIAKLFVKPGEDPNVICSACTDDRRNHTWLGLEIIRGMKPDNDKPDKFVDGTILDPRDGKTYKAQMTVSPDGQLLTVRGYLGISLLGRNQYWSRLPDSAYSMLDPSVNPNAGAAQPQQSVPLPQQPARKPMMAPGNPTPAGH